MKYKPMNEQILYYIFICQMCFQCAIYVCKNMNLWMNKLHKISITKSLNVKFIMYQLPHKHIYCKKNCLIQCLNQEEINSKYYNLIDFRGGLETKFGLNEL